MDQQNQQVEEERKRKRFLNNLEIQTGGVKNFIHGVSYQLYFIMLFLWRAKEKKYFSFCLGTELKDAEKFDDVVFQYQQNQNENYKLRFVQVKHVEMNRKRKSCGTRCTKDNIVKSDLLSKSDKNNYCIRKYFRSYVKIKNQCLERSKYSIFSGSEIDDLIIATNIDIDSNITDFFEKLQLEKDDILKISDGLKKLYPKAAIYMFKTDIAEKLKSILKETSDFTKLINELADCALLKPELGKPELFIYYYYALTKNVFSIELDTSVRKVTFCAKFLPKFIQNNYHSDDVEALQFRNALIKKIILKKEKIDIEKNKLADDDIRTILENVKFNVSNNLAKDFELPTDPKIIDVQKFANEIKDILAKSNCKLIQISETESNAVFIDNFRKLAGYVLVTKFTKIRFSTYFLDMEELPGNLNDFRIYLKELLGDAKFNSLYEYEFEINEKIFKTCEEGALHRKLPIKCKNTEIQEFFKKFKLVVNYPNAEDIGNMIGEEMEILYKTLNVDGNKSLYFDKLYKWLEDNKAKFYTTENTQKLFDDINREMVIPQIDGSSNSYIGNAFSDFKFNIYKCIPDFLCSKKHQILDLIFQDLHLGRARVVQTLQSLKASNDNADINKYILESGPMFRNLGHLEKEVVDHFNDNKRANLLVIECDKENELTKVEQLLLNTLKQNSQKKIIFIRQAEFVLTKKITEFNYIAKEDKSNFSDFTNDTQNKLLEKEIIFQGQKITLNRLLAGSSNLMEPNNLQDYLSKLSKYIDSEVLSELMKNNEIIIDSNNAANLDDMKEYFIDRKYDLDLKIELDKRCIDGNINDLFVTTYDNENEVMDFPSSDDGIINNFQSNNYLYILTMCESHRRNKSFVSSSLRVTNKLIHYKYKYPNENQEQLFVLSNFVPEILQPEFYSIILDFFLCYLDLMNQYTDEVLNVHFIVYIEHIMKRYSHILIRTDEKYIDDKGHNYRFIPNLTTYMFNYLYLYEYSEPHKLAKALVKCIFETPDFEDCKILTCFFWQLNKEIIDNANKKFHYNFIHNVTLSDVAKNFREIFLYMFRKLITESLLSKVQETFLEDFLKKIREVNISDDDIWKEIEKIQLNNLPIVFKLSNPEFDINAFTEEFIELLNTGTEDKNIKIDLTNLGTDIHNLAIYVLVQDNFYDKGLKFNSIFFDNNFEFPNNLNNFRQFLKEKFEGSGRSISELKDYRFEIEDFETCMDNDHTLPKDLIKDFLKKIIFRGRQPSDNNDEVRQPSDNNDDLLMLNIDDSCHKIKNYIEKSYEIFKYDIAQLYLLMLFLNKIKEFNFNKFCLATNLIDFDKFTDVIFKYIDSESQIRYIFVQIQLLDDYKKLNFDYLFRSHLFGLQKLFDEYINITHDDRLQDGLKKLFFIYTDSNFDAEDLKLHSIQLQKVNIIDDRVMNDVAKDIGLTEFYRLDIDKNHKIFEDLMQASPLYKLAKNFLSFICLERVININLLNLDLLLTMQVIDIKNKKLSYNFVHNKVVSEEAKKFRECFIYAYRAIYAKQNTLEHIICKELENLKLDLTLLNDQTLLNDPTSINYDTLLNDPAFHFINDVILKHEIIINICYTKLDTDNNILTCKVEILDNNTNLKVMKVYHILLSSLQNIMHRMDLPLNLDNFCKNLCPNYLSKFVKQKQDQVRTVDYDSYNFSDKYLMKFFQDLIFVQHPPEFEVDRYSSVECFRTKFPNKKLPISCIEFHDDLKRLFYNKVTPGLRWLHQEDISLTKPIRTTLAHNLKPEDLAQLFENHPDHTMHFLKKENNKFIWQSSRGPLINLREFITETKHIFKSSNIQDRVVIIAADPGMGKSTILKYQTQNIRNLHPYKWVIKIDLVNCEKQIEKQDGQFDTIDKIISFIYSVTKLQTVLADKFLRFQLEEHGQIILFFDGYDEISDKNREKIITLLKALKKYKIEKLWITTRLHLRTIIEDELSIFSYELKPFEDKDQTDFLKKYWMKAYDLNHNSKVKVDVINEYIRNLIDSFKDGTSKNDRDFLGIPLQSKMLAEAFQQNFWEFYNATLQNQQIEFNFPKNINLLNLYRKFIDTKYEIYFKDKIQSTLDKTLENILTRYFTKLHRVIAFKLLIPTEIILLNKIDEITPDDQIILRKIGIVQSENIELSFVHRTFAEYFVADQLLDCMKEDKNNSKDTKTLDFVRNVFFKDEWKVVIKFFDRILAESHPILDATINNDAKFFENDEFDIKILDDLGRNAVHLAAAYNNVGIINLVLKKTIDVNICDSIFGWTPIVYAVQNHNWDIADLLLKAGANPVDIKNVKNVKSVDENGMTTLHFAAEHTNNDIVKSLLDRDVDVNASDKKGLTPLFYAIKADNMPIMICLIEANADIKFVNKQGLDPISYAKQLNMNDTVQYLETVQY